MSYFISFLLTPERFSFVKMYISKNRNVCLYVCLSARRHGLNHSIVKLSIVDGNDIVQVNMVYMYVTVIQPFSYLMVSSGLWILEEPQVMSNTLLDQS